MDVLSPIGWHHGNQCCKGQEGLRAPAGQEPAGIVFAVTPGGSDKTSVGDAAISHREITDRKEAEGVV